MSKSWGEPLWYFFHSFSEHISEECYEKNKEEICTILKTICANLPCDDCTKHAKQYTRYSLMKVPIKLLNEIKSASNSKGITPSELIIQILIKEFEETIYKPKEKEEIISDVNSGELAAATEFLIKEEAAHKAVEKDTKRY